MALNTITPSNREEEYLSAIAGDEGASAPVPSNRHEEWLRRIAKGQGDQTDRLDHIEDQIPVDPAAADVGKVMTVIADESGETPVYKWSAEAASSGAKPYYLKNTSITGGNIRQHTSNISKTDLGADFVDELKAGFNTAKAVGADLEEWVQQHIRVYIQGIRAHLVIATSGETTGDTVTYAARIPYIYKDANSAAAFGFLDNSITLNFASDATNIVTIFERLVDDAGTAIASAGYSTALSFREVIWVGK